MTGWMNQRGFAVSTIALIAPAIAALPGTASPDPAEVLPTNTAYAILLDMREETWDQLSQYALFQQLSAQTAGTSSLGGLPFLSSLGVEFDPFMAPWVGDKAVLALLPLKTGAASAFTENEILITPIADPEAFAEQFDEPLPRVIGTLKQREAAIENYQGVDIFYWEPLFLEETPEGEAISDEAAPQELLKEMAEDAAATGGLPARWPDVPGLAIAVFPDFVVAAENPAAIRAWVDLRPPAGAPSLADNPQFQRTREHPHYDEALGVLYGDLLELVNYSFTDVSLPELPFNLPLPGAITQPEWEQLAALQTDSTVEALIYPEPRGLRLQGRGYYNNSLLADLAIAPTPASTEILAYIPQDSYGMMNGQDLAQAWQTLTLTLEATEETQALLEQARGFFTAFTGLDLDQDVFGWMDQGFSVFLYPTDQTPLTQLFPELRIGLGVALQTSDRATAEATFATLDDLVGNFLIAVEPTTLNGQPATSWGESGMDGEEPESFFGRTWVNDDTLLLTTSIAALSDLAQLEPARALPNAFRFVESTRDFPTPNQGYVFANSAPMRALFNGIFPPYPDDPESLEFRKLVASVQAFSGTLSYHEGYAQVDGLLMLAPAEAP